MSEWIETFKGAVLVSEYDSESHMNSESTSRASTRPPGSS